MTQLSFVVVAAASFDGRVAGPPRAAKRQRRRAAGRLHARQRAKAALDVLDRDQAVLVVWISRCGKVDIERDHALGRKAGIDALEADEAAHEQPGADDEDHRQGHLARHEHVSRRPRAPVGDVAAVGERVSS